MRALILLASIALGTVPVRAQGSRPPVDKADVERQRILLISDLKNLEAEGAKLDGRTARAYSKVAVADTAWYLDEAWSRKLLREAYDLTLPDENEMERLRNQPVGTNPVEPTQASGATATVRNWTMRVASRDKSFFDQMNKYAKETLGRQQQVSTSSALASSSLASSDLTAAGRYVLQSADADPTQISTLGTILAIAILDRQAADELILAYIMRLKGLALNGAALSRVYWFLGEAILPDDGYTRIYNQRIPPGGQDVSRAYVGFVIETGAGLLQESAGRGPDLQWGLIWAWRLIQQSVPEYTGAYLQLEALARASGARFPSPSTTTPPASPNGYIEARDQAVGSGSAADIVRAIGAAMIVDEFKEARRLLDLLPPGPQRDEKTEEVNYWEARSDLKSSEIYEAEHLARKLTKPYHIVDVYTGLVKAGVKKSDQYYAVSLSSEAIKRLKQTADKQDLPWMIGNFATALAPVDELLAVGLFEDLVDAANHAGLDTSVGYPGFDVKVFTALLPKYRDRMCDEANRLKDRLQRIAVLAVVYRWEVEQIRKSAQPDKPRNDQETKSSSR